VKTARSPISRAHATGCKGVGSERHALQVARDAVHARRADIGRLPWVEACASAGCAGLAV
jgi:hypothetical protein